MSSPTSQSCKEEKDEMMVCLAKAVSNQKGLVAARLLTEEKSLSIEYDPKIVSRENVLAAAQGLEQDVRNYLEKCSFRLRGRACEACARVIEVKMEQTQGVCRANASFIGGVMSISYDDSVVTEAEVLQEAGKLGVKVTPLRKAIAAEEKQAIHPPTTLSGKLALWLEGDRFEALLTFITLGMMIAGLLTDDLLHLPFMADLFYVIAYVTGGWVGVQAGWQSLRHGTIDVDLLMILAALGAAFVGHPFEGAMLLFLFSFSNVLQAFAIDRTRNAIRSLARMKPRAALVLKGQQPESTPIEQVPIDARVLIRPGDLIPLDGEVLEGESSVDQSSVTGESMPVNKAPGENVFAGTINQFGSLTIRVTKLSADSTISRLIELVEEAQSEKARTQRFLDAAEQYYAIGVVVFVLALIAILPTVFHSTYNFSTGFYTAITVLVVASPCAIIISTPASILSAIGNGAMHGILFKGGAQLERAASIKVIALDKTGTITKGKPKVTRLLPLKDSGLSETDILTLAASVEARSEHPLAAAIVEEATQRNLVWPEVKFFQSFTGKGAMATIGESHLAIGSPIWLQELGLKNEAWEQLVTDVQEGGATAVGIVELGDFEQVKRPLGVIAVADEIRPEAKEAIAHMKRIGIRRVVMLTGDSRRVAAAVAREVGVDEYFAELLPTDKVRLIRSLAEGDAVAMIGDGTNDAPALSAATVGIAMGAAGSDVALESADIVLMSSELEKVPHAISLSQEARKIVIQNLFFAVAVIIVMVTATLIQPLTGIPIPLPIGVVAHEGGTVLVCLNGLRLLAFGNR